MDIFCSTGCRSLIEIQQKGIFERNSRVGLQGSTLRVYKEVEESSMEAYTRADFINIAVARTMALKQIPPTNIYAETREIIAQLGFRWDDEAQRWITPGAMTEL